MFCSRCGTQLDDRSVFCSRCGAPVAAQAEPAPLTAGFSPRSRTIMLLLALFLGSFGVHRFYAGRNVTGGIMLILGGAGLIVAIGMAFFTRMEGHEGDAVAAWSLWLLGIDVVVVVVVKLWSLVDGILTLAGIFKDSAGRPIRKW